jgi:IclR family transcriptional regulator, acetate operon repressor
MRYGLDKSIPNTVIGRAMTVLKCYRPADAGLTLAELTRRSHLAKPTVYRLLHELAGWGVVERYGNEWRLGIQLFELGQMAPRQRDLRDAAMPFLSDLHEMTHETVHLAILDGAEVVYIEKLARAGAPELPSRVGGRMQVHCTGVGKALLAYSDPLFDAIVTAGLRRRTPHTIVAPGILQHQLTEARRCGIAYDREESTAGVTCVAAAVFDERERPAGAISISGWSSHLKGNRAESLVQAASLAISRQLRALAQQADSDRFGGWNDRLANPAAARPR